MIVVNKIVIPIAKLKLWLLIFNVIMTGLSQQDSELLKLNIKPKTAILPYAKDLEK